MIGIRQLIVALVCGLATAAANAQIYRWVDARGTIHYSNMTPPQGVKSTVVEIEAKEGLPVPETRECYSIRCQGERMEERQRRRDELEAKLAAERAAAAPKQARGLDFRRYVSIERGMSEGELITVAGEPDLVSDQGIAFSAPTTVQGARHLRVPARAGLSLRSWIYLPTPADPFTTTITLVGGRVSEVERVRKF